MHELAAIRLVDDFDSLKYSLVDDVVLENVLELSILGSTHLPLEKSSI